jgi:cation:H+ antiporter
MRHSESRNSHSEPSLQASAAGGEELMGVIAAQLLIFAVGLAILYFGAEGMLGGATRIARRFGVSPLVIGLTLVAFGTSAPELSLDVTAAFRGSTELAFGDLVGSNIANIGLILGIAAIIRPLRVHGRLLRAEVPILISVSLLVWGLSADGELSRQDGLILLAVFVLFVGYSMRMAQSESAEFRKEFTDVVPKAGKPVVDGLLVIAGLVGLIVGAQLMVHAAATVAELLGVSKLIIGLTIVAIGTSLPELATSVVAARRDDADIVVGNVVGSNVFNMLCVLALVAIVRPISVPSASMMVDVPVMAGYAFLLVPIMLRGMVVTRGEGIFLVLGYSAFLVWQIIAATRG